MPDHADPRLTLESRLCDIVRKDPILWPVLEDARRLALPDWWIVSGAIYNTVWNVLCGKPAGYGIKDIDLFYFDADTSYEAEDRVIRRGSSHFTAPLPVEIRNQARVHLWYEDHFGHAIAPLSDCRGSIRNFAAQTHAVGVRLTGDAIDIFAPYGLNAIFEMRMVPNTRNPNRETYDRKNARALGLWPELVIEPWPKRADPWH